MTDMNPTIKQPINPSPSPDLLSHVRGYGRTEVYPADLTDAELEAAQQGRLDHKLLRQTDWDSNVITIESLRKLVSALLKREPGYVGISYVAVGSGLPGWDSSRPDASAAATQLETEIARTQATVIFLDENNQEAAQITRRLEISGTFLPAQGNGVWREWGLFGGNASAALNSGLIVDYFTQDRATKINSETVIKRARIDL